MNNSTNPQIDKIIRNGYEFRFGEYISQGFKICQKAVIAFAAFWVMFFFISIVFDNFSNNTGSFGVFFSLITTCIISPCLMGSFYWMAHEADENRQVKLKHFFKGLDWGVQLILAALIQVGIFIGLMLPFILLGLVSIQNVIDFNIIIPSHLLTAEIWLLTLLFLPLIYLFISWGFAPLFIIFYEMGAWPAMEASRKVITPKWFLFFAFLIVTAIIMFLGVIGLVIGLLITIPAGVCMFYAAFRDIVGMSNEQEDDLLDHLIDIEAV